MKYDKGTSGNPNGRPPGSKNKKTEDLREWITNFIQGKTKQIELDWQSLTARERILMFEKLLKYTLPTLQSVSTEIDFEKMTEEQLDEIIERLKHQVA